jgi:hypothetical protein
VPMPCVFSAETYSSSPTEPLLSTVPSSAAGSETLVPSIWMGAAVSAAGGRACTVMFRLAERAERSTIATAAVMLAPPAAAELAESAAAGRNKLESAASSASSPASNFVASDSVAARTRATVCWYVATALAAGVAAPAVSASEMAAWKPARPALMSESSSAEVWPSPSSTSGTASSTCAVHIGGNQRQDHTYQARSDEVRADQPSAPRRAAETQPLPPGRPSRRRRPRPRRRPPPPHRGQWRAVARKARAARQR